MKKRVLVLGSTGLIGHQVFNYLQSLDKYDMHNFAYRKALQLDTVILDARNEIEYLEKVRQIAPNFIINCVGVLVNGANRDIEHAIFLNSYFPHRLMRLADEINAKLIHISTDCVFSGNKGAPYVESDFKDGKEVYSKTKAFGEIINEKHLTLRTSVVGPELKIDGEELFHWFMGQSFKIFGYTRSIWSGVTSIELARAVEWSIRKEITGLYHVTNNKPISKYKLIKLFQKHTKKKINIIPVSGRESNKSFIDTRGLLDYEIPSYDKMIFEMVEFIKKNELLYSQYGIK